jgi:hypothetical protein
MAIATSQFTIIDYNDALTLTGYITSNVQKTQMYNPDTGGYNPDWSASPFLILTPSLFKPGSADIITDTQVQSVSWFWNNAGVDIAITADANHIFSGTKSQILTIKTNELAGIPGRDYICVVVYRDPSTNLDITLKIPITFSRVVNGGGIADAVAWCPSGNIFKNGQIGSLTAQCDLWRGSTTDTSLVTYRWFKQDGLVFAPTTTAAGSTTTAIICTSVTGMVVGEKVLVGAETVRTISAINVATKTITLNTALTAAPAAGVAVKHGDYDVDAGTGWRKLVDVANNITGTTSNTITVFDAWVQNYVTLMCVIKDTDSASNTYNNLFKDVVSIVDQSDTVQAQITSTGGDVFKNAAGTTTLKCLLYQNGAEIDSAGTTYTYTWYTFDKDGAGTTFYNGSTTKTGKSISVDGNDVTVKNTFQCIVS